jgi:hypothetical protein
MQYAQFNIDGHKILLDVSEKHSLDNHMDSLVELEKPSEESTLFMICYGSYRPQPGVSDEQAVEDLLIAKDHWLGHVDGADCHMIAFHDFEQFPVEHLGHSTRIPFAAVIQASPEIIEAIGSDKSVRAVSAFLRYGDVSVPINVLNRPGIIALKGIEKRHGQQSITLANWREHIDPVRAVRTSQKIA